MAFNGYKSSYFASCEKLGRTLRWFTGAIWMLSRRGDRGTDMGQLLQGPRLHGRAACCAGRMDQRLLFDLPRPLPANLPPGFAYHRDFLDDDEERLTVAFEGRGEKGFARALCPLVPEGAE